MRTWRFVALCTMMLSLIGCATAPEQREPMHLLNSQETITWPTLPEVPRYSYAGELIGEPNFQGNNNKKTDGGIMHWLLGLGGVAKKPVVLQRPQTGVVDRYGRVFVSDVGRNAIFVFDTVANQLRTWELVDHEQRFLAPIGLAIGPDDTLLVADAELKCLVRLGMEGEPLGKIGEGKLERPTGIAFDDTTGRIFVADTQAHNIKVFDLQGKVLQVIGKRGEGRGEFNYPTHLSLRAGRLYVTDRMNARIQIFSSAGEFVASLGKRGRNVGDTPHPKGVAVDSDGNIYVLESYFDHLLIYNDRGELLLPIGGSGGGKGQFNLPAGVWVDDQDQVYIADMFNGRVVILQYLGG